MDQIRAAINDGSAEALAGLADLGVPDSYTGAVVLAEEEDMFAGLETARRIRASRCTCSRSRLLRSVRARP